MADISGAQLVVDSLKREGVDTVYVLPGDPVGGIVNGLARAGLKVIAVRHEQVAAMAARGPLIPDPQCWGVHRGLGRRSDQYVDRHRQRCRQLLASSSNRRLR